jgi:DNA-binding transcriptional LysR family regulator
MNKIEAMQAFCLVAEHHSFSLAAKKMTISATMVSRYVKQLEQSLGCLLLKRNTRKVFLTDAGDQYLLQVKPLLKKLNQIENQMHEFHTEPSGKLTISTSIEFGGQYMAPLIASYRLEYPKVALNFMLSNTPVDLFNSDTDLVFRVAPLLPNASHIAQEVCTSTLSFWANPDYLKKFGTPESPEQLSDHKLLFFNHSIRNDHWLFRISNETRAIKLPWDWASNNGRLLNEAAAQGHGIIQAPSYSVANYVKEGRLVEVMSEFKIDNLTISAIYPHRYELSNRVKTFVEMAKVHFKANPIQ